MGDAYHHALNGAAYIGYDRGGVIVEAVSQERLLRPELLVYQRSQQADKTYDQWNQSFDTIPFVLCRDVS